MSCGDGIDQEGTNARQSKGWRFPRQAGSTASRCAAGRPGLRQILGGWLDLISPPACLLCGDDVPAPEFCFRCDRLIGTSWPSMSVPCRSCGLPRPRTEGSAAPRRCVRCPAKGFPFSTVTPLGIYQGPLREAVVAAKSARHASLAMELGRRLAEKFRTAFPAPAIDCVTCVPISRLRRLSRGGAGGASRIAEGTAKALGLPAADLLRQVRRTAKQSLLSDEERVRNVRGAFAIKKSYAWRPSNSLLGMHILLVDDVLTTGSTASEVTRVLLQGGAASVHLAVLARAVRG